MTVNPGIHHPLNSKEIDAPAFNIYQDDKLRNYNDLLVRKYKFVSRKQSFLVQYLKNKKTHTTNATTNLQSEKMTE